MTHPGADAERETTTAIIVKADEVDEAGADISTISLADSSPADFDERIESRRAQDAQAKGDPKILANAVPTSPKRVNRPILRRDASGTRTPLHPISSAPPRDEPGNPTDSLSLVQLKRLITDLPKLERTAYAYEYEDTRTFPEELEEWFQYTDEERYTLLRAKLTFEAQWEKAQATSIEPSEPTLDWRDAGTAVRQQFVLHKLRDLASPDISVRVKSLECISHIALGVWGETAGCEGEGRASETDDGGIRPIDSEYRKSMIQIEWILDGAELLRGSGAVQSLMDMLGRYCTDGESVPWLLWRESCFNNAWILLMLHRLASLVRFMIKRWATANRSPRSF